MAIADKFANMEPPTIEVAQPEPIEADDTSITEEIDLPVDEDINLSFLSEEELAEAKKASEKRGVDQHKKSRP